MNQIVEPDTACQPAPAFTLRDEDRQRCATWTRVMGYPRPVASFNLGKKSEFSERTYFAEEPAQRG